MASRGFYLSASSALVFTLAVAAAPTPARATMPAEDISFEPYAMALPLNDSAMRLEVNRALTQVYVSGEIGRIFDQWFGKLGQPTGLLAAMYLLYAIPQ